MSGQRVASRAATTVAFNLSSTNITILKNIWQCNQTLFASIDFRNLSRLAERWFQQPLCSCVAMSTNVKFVFLNFWTKTKNHPMKFCSTQMFLILTNTCHCGKSTVLQTKQRGHFEACDSDLFHFGLSRTRLISSDPSYLTIVSKSNIVDNKC